MSEETTQQAETPAAVTSETPSQPEAPVAATSAPVESPAQPEAAPAEASSTPAEHTFTEVPTGPLTSKEALYKRLSAAANRRVEEKYEPTRKATGRNLKRVFPEDYGRDVLVEVFKGLVEIATAAGEDGKIVPTSVGIPGGLGSLKLSVTAPTVRNTPQGGKLEVPAKWRIKWEPGKAIKDVLAGLPAPTADVTPPRSEAATRAASSEAETESES